MVLSHIDQEIFWEIWLGLLAFVNDENDLVPDFGHPKYPWEIENYDEVLPIRNKLWEDDQVIDRYIKARPGMSKLKARILHGWKKRVQGSFLIVRYFEEYTVFLDQENDCLWGVLGVSSEIDDLSDAPLPRVVEGVLLPFKDHIIYDTLLSDYSVRVVGNLWQDTEDQFSGLKKDGVRISFPREGDTYAVIPVPDDEVPPVKPQGTPMDQNLKAQVDKLFKNNPDASIEELNKKMKSIMDAHNAAGQDRFDGLSPNQVMRMEHYGLGENGLVIKNPLPGREAPLIRQIRYFLDIVRREGSVPLTAKGNLPVKIVREIYEQGFVQDLLRERAPRKTFYEEDMHAVELGDLLCDVAHLTERRGKKLTLTARGREVLEADELFPVIFRAFCDGFNWSYFDAFPDQFENVGQNIYPFTFYLLSKYGDVEHPVSFYAQKYRAAFYGNYTDEEDIHNIEFMYSLRTFDRFLDYFGFIESIDRDFIWIKSCKVTPLFHECMEITI